MLPQPVNYALDAGLFSKSLDVLTVGRLASAEGGGLRQCIAVRNKGVVDPLADPAVRDRVGRGVIPSHAFATEVVVRMDGHDHGNFRSFGNIGEPKRNVHQGGSRESGVLFAGGKFHFNEVFLEREDFVRPVFWELTAEGIHGQIHGVAKMKRRFPPFCFVIDGIPNVLTDRRSEIHGHHKKNDGEGDGRSGRSVQLTLSPAVRGLELNLQNRGFLGHRQATTATVMRMTLHSLAFRAWIKERTHRPV